MAQSAQSIIIISSSSSSSSSSSRRRRKHCLLARPPGPRPPRPGGRPRLGRNKPSHQGTPGLPPCAPAPLQPLEFFLSASTGSLLVVAVAALRIYLAWQYVGDRLLTASLEYEETGW